MSKTKPLAVLAFAFSLAIVVPAAAQPVAQPKAAAVEIIGSQDIKSGLAKRPRTSPYTMFLDAEPVVKSVMIGLMVAASASWLLLILKLFEFAGLNRRSTRFVLSLREAPGIEQIAAIADTDEFRGNPMADMALAAAYEVSLSRKAGLDLCGAERGPLQDRVREAVGAVQSQLAKRLSGGMQILSSTGATGPFVGLFGTVYGIMYAFIGIAESNSTSLNVVAPGIAQALLATGIGLFAAIPAVIFYNYLQTRIMSYGVRSEAFVAELMNAVSRQFGRRA
ncbi:MotA/TolQ/ExbB proton channel family protein [soil metagenome]